MGYSLASEYHDGRVLMFNPDRLDMGVHIVYSGSCLRNIVETYAEKLNAYDLLQFHLAQGHTIARIDLCLDLRDSGLSIQALHNQCDARQHKTALKSHSIITGTQGTTLYIGSTKNRKRLMRIYDKAREQGLSGVDWIRIEASFYGIHAHSVAQWFNSDQDVRPALRNICDFPNDAIWTKVFNGVSKLEYSIETVTRNMSTMAWLSRQVVPALARLQLEGHDLIFLYNWVQEYIDSEYKDK